eukprot:Selendium_serpulae@DN6057_c2_g1_i11.p1
MARIAIKMAAAQVNCDSLCHGSHGTLTEESDSLEHSVSRGDSDEDRRNRLVGEDESGYEDEEEGSEEYFTEDLDHEEGDDTDEDGIMLYYQEDNDNDNSFMGDGLDALMMMGSGHLGSGYSRARGEIAEKFLEDTDDSE